MCEEMCEQFLSLLCGLHYFNEEKKLTQERKISRLGQCHIIYGFHQPVIWYVVSIFNFFFCYLLWKWIKGYELFSKIKLSEHVKLLNVSYVWGMSCTTIFWRDDGKFETAFTTQLMRFERGTWRNNCVDLD